MGRMQATIKETQVRLKDMAVAYKLWAVVLGGMVAMLGLSSGLLWFAERTDAHTRHITEAADARIAITMRWKALAFRESMMSVRVNLSNWTLQTAPAMPT